MQRQSREAAGVWPKLPGCLAGQGKPSVSGRFSVFFSV